MRIRYNRLMAAVLAASGLTFAVSAHADARLFAEEDFRGPSIGIGREADNLRADDFNDRASSVIVTGQPYQLCEHAYFEGRCIVLQPGEYRSMWQLGFENRVSSARALRRDAATADPVYVPAPAAGDFRRRSGERLFTADVIGVRAIVGPPEQRCWIEQEELPRRYESAPGALIGAVVGGILGHQVGGGSGRDLATIAGALGGAAVGANVGRGGTRDVQRCEVLPAHLQPQFYDVTYRFRGQEHHAQLARPPGDTILVNRWGEPRA